METSPPTIVETALRWTARGLSVISIAILGMFLTSEPPTPGTTTAHEWIGLAFFPFGVMAGMVIAWRREGIGAAIGIASLACFYVIYGLGVRGTMRLGWWFMAFSLPLLLFGLAWMASRTRTHAVAG
jgi:hypothetical protein